MRLFARPAEGTAAVRAQLAGVLLRLWPVADANCLCGGKGHRCDYTYVARNNGTQRTLSSTSAALHHYLTGRLPPAREQLDAKAAALVKVRAWLHTDRWILMLALMGFRTNANACRAGGFGGWRLRHTRAISPKDQEVKTYGTYLTRCKPILAAAWGSRGGSSTTRPCRSGR
jgi:hypothetical protein